MSAHLMHSSNKADALAADRRTARRGLSSLSRLLRSVRRRHRRRHGHAYRRGIVESVLGGIQAAALLRAVGRQCAADAVVARRRADDAVAGLETFEDLKTSSLKPALASLRHDSRRRLEAAEVRVARDARAFGRLLRRECLAHFGRHQQAQVLVFRELDADRVSSAMRIEDAWNVLTSARNSRPSRSIHARTTLGMSPPYPDLDHRRRHPLDEDDLGGVDAANPFGLVKPGDQPLAIALMQELERKIGKIGGSWQAEIVRGAGVQQRPRRVIARRPERRRQ